MRKFGLPVDPVGTWEEKKWIDEDISKSESNLCGKLAGFLAMTVFLPKQSQNTYVSQ